MRGMVHSMCRGVNGVADLVGSMVGSVADRVGSDLGKVVSEDGSVVSRWRMQALAHGVQLQESLRTCVRLPCQPIADAYLHVTQQRELALAE